jgi:6,7-dimethyl-8-ribityllumazine synthase
LGVDQNEEADKNVRAPRFMLAKVKPSKIKPATGRFAIVASTFNRRYVDSMLRAAKQVLSEADVRQIQIIRVPGAFEVPVVAAKLATLTPPFSAVLCLGVIFRGETTHAQHIGEAVSLTLARLQAECKIPMIHGVYLFENEAQARTRCLNPKHNRGAEIAQTALAMARVMKDLDLFRPAL